MDASWFPCCGSDCYLFSSSYSSLSPLVSSSSHLLHPLCPVFSPPVLTEQLSSLLFPPVFTPLILYLSFLFSSSLNVMFFFLPCFLPLPRFQILLISPFSSFLFRFSQSPYFRLFLSFPCVFYIYTATPRITFKSTSPPFPTSKFPSFLPSPLAFSSSFCLYPHLSLSSCLLPCSPSVFVLAVLAYSAGSTPAMPIILTEEKEKEKRREGDGRRRKRGEGWTTCACGHKSAQILTYMLMEGKNESGWRAQVEEKRERGTDEIRGELGGRGLREIGRE